MKTLEEIKEIVNLKIVSIDEQDGFLAYWFDPITQKGYSIVMSWGGGWEHLSVNPLKMTKLQVGSKCANSKICFSTKTKLALNIIQRKRTMSTICHIVCIFGDH